MKEMEYIVGDVRKPIGDKKKLICQCVNDKGRMGAGVALAIMKMWPQVREQYIQWFKTNQTPVIHNIDGTFPNGEFKLGNIQFVNVIGRDTTVINMIAQHDTIDNVTDGIPPIRYDAMRECLNKVYNIAAQYNASVNIPYLMGCDLAGGDWDIVEKIIQEELCDKDIEVVIYDLYNKLDRDHRSGI